MRKHIISQQHSGTINGVQRCSLGRDAKEKVIGSRLLSGGHFFAQCGAEGLYPCAPRLQQRHEASQPWWHMPGIPAFGRSRQEIRNPIHFQLHSDLEFSVSYRSLKKKKIGERERERETEAGRSFVFCLNSQRY